MVKIHVDRINIKPNCYIVTFVSELKSATGYHDMAQKMMSLAQEHQGFLGADSVRSENGKGITISYWESLEAIRHWRNNPEHREAQKRGKQEWYDQYQITVAKICNVSENLR